MEDTTKKLGTVRKQDEGRDAVHIAVLTMQAKVTYANSVPRYVNAQGDFVRTPKDAVGITDPFIPYGTTINKGDWFYVYLFPASITGLQHVWTHPAFPDKIEEVKPDVEAAEKRVREWCTEVPYDVFIEVLKTGDYVSYPNPYWVDEPRGLSIYDDYIISHGADAYGEIPAWVLDDVEIIIGGKLKWRPRAFSCSC